MKNSSKAEPEYFCTSQACNIKAFVIGNRNGSKRFLMIHGWCGSGIEYIRVAEKMAELDPEVLCICPDLPGTGFSDKPSDVAYNLPYFRLIISDMLNASRTFGYKSQSEAAAQNVKLSLVGHSLGGHMVIDYICSDTKSSNIDNLILIAPAGWPNETGSFKKWASKSNLALKIVPDFITYSSYLSTYKSTIVYDNNKVDPTTIAYTVEGLWQDGGKEALRRVSKNSLETDYIDTKLESITEPVILLWGHNDKMLAYSFSEKFLEKLPKNTQFFDFDKCGHMPHYEYPSECAQIFVSTFD